MRRILAALAILAFASAPAVAGPNLGGVLIVHDTGLTFSTVADLPAPPVTTPPATCIDTDNEAPLGEPTLQTVWKVYASFPDNSSPRVKGLAWGITGSGHNYVTTAGLPDPPNCFHIVQGSWPSPPGSIGQSFAYVQTAQIVECYWFAGYAYGGLFATAPHETQESDFVDDANIVDPIEGFSSLGFGVAGVTICPIPHDEPGACCFPDGSCELLNQEDCVWEFYGGPCTPNPCTCCPLGACCVPDGDCLMVTAADCASAGGDYQGDDIPCTPDLCIPDPSPTEQKSWGEIKATFR